MGFKFPNKPPTKSVKTSIYSFIYAPSKNKLRNIKTFSQIEKFPYNSENASNTQY